MKEILIITGKQGSGKTTKAIELTKQKKTVWINNISISLIQTLKHTLKKDTEVIVFNGLEGIYYKKLVELMKLDTITFRPPYAKNNITIERPSIIVVASWCYDVFFESQVKDIKRMHLLAPSELDELPF